MSTRTRVVTFRLDNESEPGQIFQKWETAGYSPRRIIEMALRYMEGVEPEPQHDLGEATVAELQRVVNKLEYVVKSIQQNGGIITEQHQTEIDDALDPRFVQGMKRVVRPGFTQRPPEAGE